MKGNKKILAVAVLLLLISVTFSTYAIYRTSVAANGNVTAAKWDVEFKNGQTEVTNNYNLEFSTSDCSNAHVADGKIAPGASCTKTITLDAGESEVDVAYTAVAGTPTIGGNAVDAAANDFTVTLSSENGTITYDNATRTLDITVTVTWAGEDDSNAQTNPNTINDADTGLQGATIIVPITLTAKQVPVTAAP